MSALRDAAKAALDRGRPERAWDRVASALDSDRLVDRLCARRLLLAIAPRLPEAAWTDARVAVAKRVGATPRPPEDRVGVLVFPAVDPTGEGQFIELQVSTCIADQDQICGAPDPSTEAAALAALNGARVWLGESHWRFKVCFGPASAWRGASAGLAVALAATSAARGTPISSLICATGEVDLQGLVRPVGGVEEKLALLRQARPHARMLVPAEDDPGCLGLIPVSTREDVLAALALRADGDVTTRVAHAVGLDQRGDWLGAAREAEALLPHVDLTADERGRLLALLLGAANHTADAGLAARWFTLLEPLLQSEDVEEQVWVARAVGSRAVSRIDALDVDGATDALRLAMAKDWGKAARPHIDGPRALLATLTGDHACALALRRALTPSAPIDDKPRCLGDLADALLRAGQPAAALVAAEDALAAAKASARRQGYMSQTTAFLELHRARALFALGRDDDALAALALPSRRPGLDPALRARLLAAEIRVSLAEVETAALAVPTDLRANVLISALIDRSRARLGDKGAEYRLLALTPFVGLALEEACRRLPY